MSVELNEIYFSDADVANAAETTDDVFQDVADRDKIAILRGPAPDAGTYELRLHWSRDGQTTDFIQVLNAAAVPVNTPVEFPVVMPFLRVRVGNTGGAPWTNNPKTVVSTKTPI